MRSYPFRRTSTRWLGVLLSLFVMAACSGHPRSSTSSQPTASASFQPTPSPSAGPLLTSLDGTVSGVGAFPGWRMEAPPTWSPHGTVIWNDTPHPWLAISVWDVSKVTRNPCHSIGHTYDPGTTVDDLVTALEAQSMRHATAPMDVTLAGYPGKYLEWSVPRGMKVTRGSDFTGCDLLPDGHRYFVSWYDNGDGERYQQMAGQVDRLWILNVNGQRLVVDATHSPDATRAQVIEENQIVRSLQFVPTT